MFRYTLKVNNIVLHNIQCEPTLKSEAQKYFYTPHVNKNNINVGCRKCVYVFFLSGK